MCQVVSKRYPKWFHQLRKEKNLGKSKAKYYTVWLAWIFLSKTCFDCWQSVYVLKTWLGLWGKSYHTIRDSHMGILLCPNPSPHKELLHLCSLIDAHTCLTLREQISYHKSKNAWYQYCLVKLGIFFCKWSDAKTLRCCKSALWLTIKLSWQDKALNFKRLYITSMTTEAAWYKDEGLLWH